MKCVVYDGYTIMKKCKVLAYFCVDKSILIQRAGTREFESGCKAWKKYLGIKNRPFLYFIYIKVTKNAEKWKKVLSPLYTTVLQCLLENDASYNCPIKQDNL